MNDFDLDGNFRGKLDKIHFIYIKCCFYLSYKIPSKYSKVCGLTLRIWHCTGDMNIVARHAFYIIKKKVFLHLAGKIK